MHQPRLQDRIARGLGAAARHIGAPYDAFRPKSAHDPLATPNRYLRLHAAFNAEDPGFKHPNGYGRATWFGVFDSAYTRPGDYLRGPAGIFFIAAQPALLPNLCVLANRVMDLSRPAAATAAGVNAYGGVLATTSTPLLTGWPGSILTAGSGSPGDLPSEANIPSWTVLLPDTPVQLRSADIIRDDLGRAYTIGTCEYSGLGWRILAKQAAT
jgi:hypothetical protein